MSHDLARPRHRLRRLSDRTAWDIPPLPSLVDLRPFFASQQDEGPESDQEAGKPAEARRALTGRLRVLVIEDNQDTADALALLLEDNGYPAIVANTGRKGLALARTWRPEVVLLDLVLPDVNGYAVARQLRDALRPGLASLIAVTGYARDREREMMHGARFDHYLVKPVSFATILDLLVIAQRR